jgi:hypothetical protein
MASRDPRFLLEELAARRNAGERNELKNKLPLAYCTSLLSQLDFTACPCRRRRLLRDERGTSIASGQICYKSCGLMDGRREHDYTGSELSFVYIILSGTGCFATLLLRQLELG